MKKPPFHQTLFLSTAFLSSQGTHHRYFPKKKKKKKKKARGITFQSECGEKTKSRTSS
jgi:homospermidine synthase